MNIFYILDELENNLIKIECYWILSKIFSNNEEDNKKKLLVDYMSHFFLGETNITKENIDNNKKEYTLYDKDKNKNSQKKQNY